MSFPPLPPATAGFLSRSGWADADVRPLAGDASFRAYFRAHKGDETAVVMVAPPDKESVEPFVAIGRHLESLGLSVPHVMAADPDAGLALLEDLGDDLFPVAISNGASEHDLYLHATDVLIHVHNQACPTTLAGVKDAHDLPVFTATRLQDEVDRVLEWHWQAIHGAPAPQTVRHEYHAAWAPLWQRLERDRLVLTQFDYHSPNLMWLPHRAGLRKIGVLDFQDSLQGPAAYDVVSLLQDPRRDLAPGLEEAMILHYIAGRKNIDLGQFETAYAILGAQRAARILGTFVRLWKRDGKSGYLQHQPRVWRYLDRNFAHPDMAAVKAWFDTHVPLDRRGAYWVQSA
jgi:N-acetylmuramate 1-kinase